MMKRLDNFPIRKAVLNGKIQKLNLPFFDMKK